MTHSFNEFDSNVFACDNCSETITRDIYNKNNRKFRNEETAAKQEYHQCAECSGLLACEICGNYTRKIKVCSDCMAYTCKNCTTKIAKKDFCLECGKKELVEVD